MKLFNYNLKHPFIIPFLILFIIDINSFVVFRSKFYGNKNLGITSLN